MSLCRRHEIDVAVSVLFVVPLREHANPLPCSKQTFKYPRRPFATLLTARQWVSAFVQWYNHAHRHSAIRFVTPAERHAGLDHALLKQRIHVYEAAKARHPERWSGNTRNWQPVRIVHLNPDQRVTETHNKKEANLTLKKAA